MMGAMTTHEAPLTHVATVTVTVVMAEVDGQGVFTNRAGDVRYDLDVRWIVAAEALVCPTCGGSGVRLGPWSSVIQQVESDCICPNCNGTGLPDVQIVSAGHQLEDGSISEPHLHGVVLVGAAMRILYDVDGVCTNPHHLIHNWERIVGVRRDLVIECIDGQADDITDQFGSQAVTPGMWAHPILT